MPIAASASSWLKRKPLPVARKQIPIVWTLSQADYELLCFGVVPRNMDDHWFVYAEEGWAYFHRAWTGFGVYWVRFARGSQGWHAMEAWASREMSQYTGDSPTQEAEAIKSIGAQIVIDNRSHGVNAL